MSPRSVPRMTRKLTPQILDTRPRKHNKQYKAASLANETEVTIPDTLGKRPGRSVRKPISHKTPKETRPLICRHLGSAHRSCNGSRRRLLATSKVSQIDTHICTDEREPDDRLFAMQALKPTYPGNGEVGDELARHHGLRDDWCRLVGAAPLLDLAFIRRGEGGDGLGQDLGAVGEVVDVVHAQEAEADVLASVGLSVAVRSAHA